jgi:hypothetical protein
LNYFLMTASFRLVIVSAYGLFFAVIMPQSVFTCSSGSYG